MWLEKGLNIIKEVSSNFRKAPARPAAAPETRTRSCVVIIGSGFGGLNVARELAKGEVEVMLLDRNNYHGFWPLLYQVATAELVPDAIAFPVREFVRKYPKVTFHMAEVCDIDLKQK